MLDYETFKRIFDKKIFENARAHLVKSVADQPDRFIGIFRSTKPETKLLQNVLQSNEIRFGDAFEAAIGQYFVQNGWHELPKIIINLNKKKLSIDQLLEKDQQILFIEQKVRDDHDSSKKEGQMTNFERKIVTIKETYGDNFTKGYFYFIDPTMHANMKYYLEETAKLSRRYNVELTVCYGQELFDQTGYPEIWNDVLANLQKWREDIPDKPTINLDSDPLRSSIELETLNVSVFKKLFANQMIVDEILPILFPTGESLFLALDVLRSKATSRNHSAIESIERYIEKREVLLLQTAA